MLRLKVLFSQSDFPSFVLKTFFFAYDEDLISFTTSSEILFQDHGSLSGFAQSFFLSTAMPGLIPSGKSSKLSANKLLLTSLAWKQWAGNTGQIHWLLKGIWFLVSRLPISAFSSAVGPSSCRCCTAYLKVVSRCWTIAESCDFPIMKEQCSCSFCHSD